MKKGQEHVQNPDHWKFPMIPSGRRDHDEMFSPETEL